MQDKYILKMALVFCVAGIFIVLILSQEMPDYTEIGNVSYRSMDQDVRVRGKIFSFKDLPSTFLMDLKDDTGMITVIAFKKENVTLKEGDLVEVYGTVTEYKNRLELEAKQIRIFL